MKVYVKMNASWRRLELDVESTNTIFDIKQMINQKEGIPILSMVLIVNQKPKSDFLTVSELNINSKIFVFVLVLIFKLMEKIMIWCKLMK